MEEMNLQKFLILYLSGNCSKRYTESWFLRNNFGHFYDQIKELHPSFSLRDAAKIEILNDGSSLCKKCSTQLTHINWKKPFLCQQCCSSIRTERRNTTNLEKYGSVSPFGSEHTTKKTKLTMDKRYSGHSSKLADVAQKMRATMHERYGVEFPSQSEFFRKKASETMQLRYGTSSGRKASVILNRTETSKFYNENPSELISLYHEKKIPLRELENQTDIQRLTLSKMLGSHVIKHRRSSYPERRFAEQISDWFSVDVVLGTRKIISPLEIDIWIPEHNLGIEYHGLYWHSYDTDKTDFSHQRKFIKSREKEITLLQFWSSEVEHQEILVKTVISDHIHKIKPKFRTEYDARYSMGNMIDGFSSKILTGPRVWKTDGKEVSKCTNKEKSLAQGFRLLYDAGHEKFLFTESVGCVILTK